MADQPNRPVTGKTLEQFKYCRSRTAVRRDGEPYLNGFDPLVVGADLWAARDKPTGHRFT